MLLNFRLIIRGHGNRFWDTEVSTRGPGIESRIMAPEAERLDTPRRSTSIPTRLIINNESQAPEGYVDDAKNIELFGRIAVMKAK